MDRERYDTGLRIRREVMGSERIDNVDKAADDFTRPIHTLITEYCWGEIWSQPHIDRKTRSLMTLAMLAAMNRSNELKLHINGAINNGVSKEEIRECFLQVAIYAGVPAGLEATNIANAIIKERV
ncbi:carboxymuconolactone decarboxylase family protein [Hydrogenophaga sp. 2FB]|uniref:carboxymuconolactone decarboxylase family protein n=1 Tax=Hydrogenophaga sp. 2FB TaxID=2502187 RepID=UPI0010F7AAD5|nr:carboxymuconolactone decarboxylase family protein [Hydrogenophaga sp. 2FB]